MRARILLICGAILPGYAFANSIYDATVLANNPVLFVPIDEKSGTTATNLATAAGAQNGVDNLVTLGIPGGPDGSGGAFTSIGSFISVPNYGAVDVTSALSLEVWVDVTSANANAVGGIFAINRALNSTGLALRLNGGHPEIDFNNNAINYAELSTGTVTSGQWNEIVVTWSEGAPTFYINGVATGNQDANMFTQLLNLSTTLPVSIGAEFPNQLTPGGRWFTGDIEDVSFYNTALTASQVAAGYQAGVPEPGSLLLIGAGLLFVAERIRRDRIDR